MGKDTSGEAPSRRLALAGACPPYTDWLVGTNQSVDFLGERQLSGSEGRNELGAHGSARRESYRDYSYVAYVYADALSLPSAFSISRSVCADPIPTAGPTVSTYPLGGFGGGTALRVVQMFVLTLYA